MVRRGSRYAYPSFELTYAVPRLRSAAVASTWLPSTNNSCTVRLSAFPSSLRLIIAPCAADGRGHIESKSMACAKRWAALHTPPPLPPRHAVHNLTRASCLFLGTDKQAGSAVAASARPQTSSESQNHACAHLKTVDAQASRYSKSSYAHLPAVSNNL
jgi:hypothetical protein